MEYIYKNISLDVHNDIASQVTLNAKQGDTARGIRVALKDHGRVFNIPDGCRAVFSALKSNGVYISDNCIIANNTIEYKFTEEIVSVEAQLDCEITVYSRSGDAITSPSFTIFIYRKIEDEYSGEIVESDSFKTLNNLISDATHILALADEAIERTNDAISSADQATENAIEATENADQAAEEARAAIALDEAELKEMLYEVMPIGGYTVNVSWLEDIFYNYSGYIKPDNGEEIEFNPDTSPCTFNNVNSLTFRGVSWIYIRNADTGDMIYENNNYESFTLPITSNMNLEFATEA